MLINSITIMMYKLEPLLPMMPNCGKVRRHMIYNSIKHTGLCIYTDMGSYNANYNQKKK